MNISSIFPAVLLLFITGVFVSPLPDTAAAETDDMILPGLWFEQEPSVRENDGRTSKKIRVRFRGVGPDRLAAYYTVGRKEVCYRADMRDGVITLTSRRTADFHIWAVGDWDGQSHVARTDAVLFADDGGKAERAICYPESHAVFSLELDAGRVPYWPQTGQSFMFRIRAGGFGESAEVLGPLRVFTNGRMRELTPDEKPAAVYVPDHDSVLRRAGAVAGRNDVVFTTVRAGRREWRLTYTLYVHRSRTAFEHKGGGAAVLAAGFFFTTGWILLHRKRRAPW